MSRKRIPISKGQVAIVDACDFNLVGHVAWYAKWSEQSQTWYAARTIRVDGRKKTEYMHRVILRPRPGLVTDHKDGNGLHNWRTNLRRATHSQNASAGRAPGNKTGYRGVSESHDPRYKMPRYKYQLVHEKVLYTKNGFKTALAASDAYQKKSKELRGAFHRKT